jgi:hypothetical protein
MKTTEDLKKYLQQKAVELKSDFNDVPEWVINASAEFFNQGKSSMDKYLENIVHYTCQDSDEDDKAIVEFLLEADDDVLDEPAHGFEFHKDGKVIEIIVWEPIEHYTLRQLSEAIGM